MAQVQGLTDFIALSQILAGSPVFMLHGSNTQSSWDFQLQSQRNYLKLEISKATSDLVNVHK